MYYKNIVVSIIILYIAYPLYPNKIEEILHTSIFNEATITNTFSSEYEFYTTFGEDEILVFGNYKEIVLWDVHDNNEIMKLEGSFRGKSPRGSYIVISKDNKKILWDTEQKKTHLEVSGSLLGFSSDETFECH